MVEKQYPSLLLILYENLTLVAIFFYNNKTSMMFWLLSTQLEGLTMEKSYY
jgi:hypothetical protein